MNLKFLSLWLFVFKLCVNKYLLFDLVHILRSTDGMNYSRTSPERFQEVSAQGKLVTKKACLEKLLK